MLVQCGFIHNGAGLHDMSFQRQHHNLPNVDELKHIMLQLFCCLLQN